MMETSEQLMRFRSALAGARFRSFRLLRHRIRGDDAQQFFAGAFKGEHRRSKQRRPLPQSVNRALEAQPFEFDAVRPSGDPDGVGPMERAGAIFTVPASPIPVSVQSPVWS